MSVKPPDFNNTMICVSDLKYAEFMSSRSRDIIKSETPKPKQVKKPAKIVVSNYVSSFPTFKFKQESSADEFDQILSQITPRDIDKFKQI